MVIQIVKNIQHRLNGIPKKKIVKKSKLSVNPEPLPRRVLKGKVTSQLAI